MNERSSGEKPMDPLLPTLFALTGRLPYFLQSFFQKQLSESKGRRLYIL